MGKRRWRFYGVALLAVSFQAQAATPPATTYSDGDFGSAAWTVVKQETNSSVVTVSTNSSGGNPGSYLTLDTNAPNYDSGAGSPGYSSAGAYLRNTAFTYDPKVQGAIDSVAVSIDVKDSNHIQAFGVIVWQGGQMYMTGGQAPRSQPATTWTPIAGYVNLHASDFHNSNNATPDFSASGAPIQFGFFGANSGNSHGITGYDNYKVTVTPASPPVIAPALASVAINGNERIKGGSTATYTLSASYSDGATKTASDVAWTLSGNGATIDAKGTLTTTAGLTADAVVTITASYTENGVTKTSQKNVTIAAAETKPSNACSGSEANFSEIAIDGNIFKKPGDALAVSYCLKNFDSGKKFDIYFAIMAPDGSFTFLQSAQFFGTPSLTPYDGRKSPLPYLSSTSLSDQSGTVLSIPALPKNMPTGTYTFFAVSVPAGKNVFQASNWVGQLVQGEVMIEADQSNTGGQSMEQGMM